MKTKGYKRFLDRMDYFNTDIEVAEILVLNRENIKGTGDLIFKKVTEDYHPILSNRQNSKGSRKIVVNHLKKTVYVAFIKEMYEEVTEYLKYILREAALNSDNPHRLVGEHKVNMSANDLLSKPTRKDIIEAIMYQIFQQLENEKSTLELIKKVRNKLGLTISDDIINAALPYLEIRHIFVHADGKPCEEFLEKYPTIQLDAKNRIALNSDFAKRAFSTVKTLLHTMDQDMLAKEYVSSSEKME